MLIGFSSQVLPVLRVDRVAGSKQLDLLSIKNIIGASYTRFSCLASERLRSWHPHFQAFQSIA
ncbi:hypothetical protein, partial [Streptomyces sp. P17]|uniref:hypothetical protein n=1 Tax=Streptomyces sp. P17 TaxID=3074716 RepID=UPI0028F408B9